MRKDINKSNMTFSQVPLTIEDKTITMDNAYLTFKHESKDIKDFLSNYKEKFKASRDEFRDKNDGEILMDRIKELSIYFNKQNDIDMKSLMFNFGAAIKFNPDGYRDDDILISISLETPLMLYGINKNLIKCRITYTNVNSKFSFIAEIDICDDDVVYNESYLRMLYKVKSMPVYVGDEKLGNSNHLHVMAKALDALIFRFLEKLENQN